VAYDLNEGLKGMNNNLSLRGHSRRKWRSMAILSLCCAAAGLAILMLALILGYTLVRGISYLNLNILTQAAKPMGEAGGGMRNEIFGTLILVLLGAIIALPIGLLTGIFLSEFANPKVASTGRFMADILAGVPSIVVGVFVYAIMVMPMHSYSTLSAGVALAIIMVPVVARTAEESLRLVPNSMREAALALGITRWRAVIGVVVPGAMTGIITGIMLAVARIAGETAPLLFTALGSQFGVQGLLKPIGSLSLQIYRYALSPYPSQQQQAWAGAFLLIILVLGISIIVRWVSNRKRI
jgi:phosphate transport system permease protein